jgi:hypothetical protein
VKHRSGRTYTAAANGQIAIPAPDAIRYQGDGLQFAASDLAVVPGLSTQSPLIALYWTCTTADRPGLVGQGTTGLTNPAPAPGLAFYDTTLAKMIFYVGNLTSTGWTDTTGAGV